MSIEIPSIPYPDITSTLRYCLIKEGYSLPELFLSNIWEKDAIICPRIARRR
jgi:hypothetical protein